MGQTYAGILGPIAFLLTVARGLIHGGGAETTLKIACLCLFLFAGVGYLLGRIAEYVVEDSVRARLQIEIDAMEPEGQAV